ncbi:hypothetical protein OG21DRAFT_1512091 [Imleria badia]|nr:hypothetical protein OG21DRAFT_1512091 [Imleria badia]
MQDCSIPVSFPFDADLTDLILTTLSDIHSLESFVLSSKFVYNVFNARRASVLRAVVSNHLGPATPSAMRLVKVMMDVDSYWRGWLAPLPVTKLPREDYFQPNGLYTIVTTREAHMLVTNHDVVRELESLYSWRKKDSRSSSSRLTPRESERFQTALYRVWFVCALYGRPAPANRVGKSKSKRLSEIQRDLGRAQASFLQSFTPSQMAPLLQAWAFMMDLAMWTIRAEFLPQKNHSSLEAYLVWSGPNTTLQAFQGKLTSVDRKVVPAQSAQTVELRDPDIPE